MPKNSEPEFIQVEPAPATVTAPVDKGDITDDAIRVGHHSAG